MGSSFPGSGVDRFQEESENQLSAFSRQLSASFMPELLPCIPAKIKLNNASAASSALINLKAES
ncbi:MAG: hypothetical protein ACLPM3_00370 [Terracidiphilus sp.]